MRYIRKYIIGSLALPLLLLSCTDNGLTVANPNGGSASGGMVRTELSISTPAALSASLTRAVSVANESTLNGNFAVFGFDSSVDTLMFVLKTDSLAASSTTYGTGDTNTESNLNGENDYASAYGDYTTSPSIAWHPADDTNSSGRLYIEYWETPDPVHLLVLSNVDSTAIAALLTADETDPGSEPAIAVGMSFSDVTAALAPALDYAVKDANATYQVSVVGERYGLPDDEDPTPEYIPMTGECTLDNGIMLGSSGSISLRRSVAKMSFNFSWTTNYYGTDEQGHVNLSDTVTENRDFDKNPRKFKVFIPDTVRIVNIYRYATVYAGPSTELGTENTVPNYSTLNYSENAEVPTQIDTIKYDATIPITADDFYYDEEGNMHVSVDLLLAETKNTCRDAYIQDEGSATGFSPNSYPRVSVLVCGTYYDTDVDTDGTLSREGWYRMDLIPDDGGYQELGEILRNHHYKFEIVDPTKRPSSNALNAFELSVPDNYRSGAIGSLVVIDDEDYVSITADSDYGDANGVPYYIAVSATYVDLERTEGACALVKMETNYPSWSIDESEIPFVQTTSDEGGQMVYAMDIVYDSIANTIYVWLDFPKYVEVYQTYAYYIVAGNIRKKMRVHIVEGKYEDEDEESDEGGN